MNSDTLTALLFGGNVALVLLLCFVGFMYVAVTEHQREVLKLQIERERIQSEEARAYHQQGATP